MSTLYSKGDHVIVRGEEAMVHSVSLCPSGAVTYGIRLKAPSDRARLQRASNTLYVDMYAEDCDLEFIVDFG